MRVTIDQDKCIASGQCVIVAEGVFGQRDEDGVAVALDATPSEEHAEAVREAVALCPARAIAVAESDVAGERG